MHYLVVDSLFSHESIENRPAISEAKVACSDDCATEDKFMLDATFGPPLLHFGDLHPPPPRRQKIFGQCTILGVKKFFRTYPNFS
jgi:hypothetical protein